MLIQIGRIFCYAAAVLVALVVAAALLWRYSSLLEKAAVPALILAAALVCSREIMQIFCLHLPAVCTVPHVVFSLIPLTAAAVFYPAIRRSPRNAKHGIANGSETRTRK